MNKTRVQQSDVARLREFGLKVLGRHGALSPEEEQGARSGLAEMQMARSGSEMLAEGTPLNRAQILLEGWGVRQRTLADGRRQIFSFVLPGDIFGICARPHGETSFATVALTPATVAPLPFMDEVMRRSPPGAVGHIAQDALSLEESLLISQVVRLGRQSAYERLISLLLEFQDRLVAVGLVEDGGFTLPFTQEVLSDALGLSTVHTNRTLQQLRREHLIETHNTHVKLMDMRLLAEISDYRQPAALAAHSGPPSRQ